MAGKINKPLRYLLQAANYTVFVALIWYFASSPPIRIIEENQAVITIAFAHAGKLREPCRKLSSEELAKLAPNMRKPEECPRERSPVTIVVSLDSKTIYDETLLPPGLFKDGSINIYFSARVPAGKHHLEIKMDDSTRDGGVNYSLAKDVEIKPAQILLIEFSPLEGFFVK